MTRLGRWVRQFEARGFSGLTVYLDKGHLVCLYHMLIIEQNAARRAEPVPAGKHTIKIATTIEGPGKVASRRTVGLRPEVHLKARDRWRRGPKTPLGASMNERLVA